MSLMWIPAQTTLPPLRTARSAAGTSSPAGANRSAAARSPGGPGWGEAIAPVRHRQLGIAAVECVPGEPSAVAEVLASGAAEAALAARPAEPRDADAPAAAADLAGRP